jgi:hypothetical protein
MTDFQASDRIRKMVDEAAQDAAKDHPVDHGEAIARLDKHCSGESSLIWYAWCSVRQALLNCRTGIHIP